MKPEGRLQGSPSEGQEELPYVALHPGGIHADLVFSRGDQDSRAPTLLQDVEGLPEAVPPAVAVGLGPEDGHELVPAAGPFLLTAGKLVEECKALGAPRDPFQRGAVSGVYRRLSEGAQLDTETPDPRCRLG